ncbi:MAG: hypothetical protein RLZZ42_293 [Bacteroidota bacterium]|jgi:hypothetical protein
MKLLLLSLSLCLLLSVSAQVGIGVAVPHPSAELDVTATNKGFLPPRMTKVQRDSIVSPATGLMIFCTNCTPKGDPQFYDGTRWSSMNAAPVVHTIGENYGGGIVFFVTTDGLHGLIAETVDQSTSCTWYDAQDIISTNATHSADGKLYTDWRLPTKNELNLMYGQKKIISGLTSNYWSSTAANDNSNLYAWFQSFDNGVQSSIFGKSVKLSLRAVRSF